MTRHFVRRADAGIDDAGFAGAGPSGAGLPGSALTDTGLPDSGLPRAGLTDTGLPGSGLTSSGLTSSGLTSSGLTGSRLTGIGENTPGATVTGFDVCSLAPGSHIPPRVQSFEECFYVLAGMPVLQSDATATLLRAGDYGLIPVGTPHAWFNEGSEPARWASMRSPQPRARHNFDTYPVSLDPPSAPIPVDARDPRTRAFGHIELSQMDVGSVSMATALMVYTGIAVKMMVDSNLGARLTTMFMVHYDPDGAAGAHDHPFEETYLFLEGEAEAEFDGTVYRLGPGDLAFAGAGCVHGFRNAGGGPLRWLETQAPQPPSQHSYRFVRDWAYLRSVTGDP